MRTPIIGVLAVSILASLAAVFFWQRNDAIQHKSVLVAELARNFVDRYNDRPEAFERSQIDRFYTDPLVIRRHLLSKDGVGS